MPNRTRDMLKRECERLINNLEQAKAHIVNMVFVYQEGQQIYNSDYSEHLIYLAMIDDSLTTIQKVTEQYKDTMI